MPSLKEVIGLLLSELVEARRIMDQKTLEVAESYLADPYLKHMKIGNFDLSKVNLSFPVLIESAGKKAIRDVVDKENKQTIDINHSKMAGPKKITDEHILGIPFNAFYQTSIDLLINLAHLHNLIELLPRIDRFKKAVEEANELLRKQESDETNTEASFLESVAQYYSKTILRAIRPSMSASSIRKNPQLVKDFEQFQKIYTKELMASFVSLATVSEVTVSAITKEIMESGAKEKLFTVNIELIQTDLTWTITEDKDGNQTKKLVPY